MNIFLLIVHILVAILLVIIILIQRGRGGGLVESFSGMESMFGTKTSQFLTRTTAILATLFLFTSISLALLAARQTRSLIDEEAIEEEAVEVRIGEEEELQKEAVEEEAVEEGIIEEEIEDIQPSGQLKQPSAQEEVAKEENKSD